MASIAVDRVQNYFQYKDAEAKYYQTLKSETKDMMATDKVQQQPILNEQTIVQEPKTKKIKKNKNKSTSSENSQDQKIESLSEKAQSTENDVSLKTDQGQALTATAKKNAAKKKKQREKKAAAALAAKQSDNVVEIPKTTVESIDAKIDSPISATKAKDKKKKTKLATTDEKNGVESSTSSTLATEIAKAREHIKSSLDRVVNLNNMPGSELLERISSLEKDNQDLRGIINGLQNLVVSLEGRLNKLDGGASEVTAAPSASAKEEDDDDVDLFGSDEEEDAEAEKLKEERVKAYAEKKSKKPALIAKSSILLDCKPWDDETDMSAMEKQIRTIEMDGLIWGVSKLVPLAYGIKKLQILCVIEDDKVSVDELQEKIQEFEDFVQSVDIAAFNKI